MSNLPKCPLCHSTDPEVPGLKHENYAMPCINEFHDVVPSSEMKERMKWVDEWDSMLGAAGNHVADGKSFCWGDSLWAGAAALKKREDMIRDRVLEVVLAATAMLFVDPLNPADPQEVEAAFKELGERSYNEDRK